ncbi:hypothetical protein AK812_SmicGene16526 [Symbiodinium microadriaticum]|uniref:Uncharacterized protein n=1 Tax=Symbiodinium microadriaticum TaxID=2951 RepID=A0A1Q9E007_SYMMI|nr:hypothetical protein AK812_SmicGene16526 [Symbiodinium microadriaticum]
MPKTEMNDERVQCLKDFYMEFAADRHYVHVEETGNYKFALDFMAVFAADPPTPREVQEALHFASVMSDLNPHFSEAWEHEAWAKKEALLHLALRSYVMERFQRNKGVRALSSQAEVGIGKGRVVVRSSRLHFLLGERQEAEMKKRQEACLDTDETQVFVEEPEDLEEEAASLAESSSSSEQEGHEEESPTDDELVQPVDLHDDQVECMLERPPSPVEGHQDDNATVHFEAEDVPRPTQEDMVRLALDFASVQQESEGFQILQDLEEEDEEENMDEREAGMTRKDELKGSVKEREPLVKAIPVLDNDQELLAQKAEAAEQEQAVDLLKAQAVMRKQAREAEDFQEDPDKFLREEEEEKEAKKKEKRGRGRGRGRGGRGRGTPKKNKATADNEPAAVAEEPQAPETAVSNDGDEDMALADAEAEKAASSGKLMRKKSLKRKKSHRRLILQHGSPKKAKPDPAEKKESENAKPGADEKKESKDAKPGADEKKESKDVKPGADEKMEPQQKHDEDLDMKAKAFEEGLTEDEVAARASNLEMVKDLATKDDMIELPDLTEVNKLWSKVARIGVRILQTASKAGSFYVEPVDRDFGAAVAKKRGINLKVNVKGVTVGWTRHGGIQPAWFELAKVLAKWLPL